MIHASSAVEKILSCLQVVDNAQLSSANSAAGICDALRQ